MLPENDYGNIEYKRKLDPKNQTRFSRLQTQMLWRLYEGNNEAVYFLGIDDDGQISGLTKEDLDKSIEIFNKLVKHCKASITSREIIDNNIGYYAKIQISRLYVVSKKKEAKIALLGDSGSGKTTLVGLLVNGYEDNGLGSARARILKHGHELKNGKTTSITYELIGYNNNERTISNTSFVSTREDLINKSDTIVTLIDLPGNRKYIKKVIYALMVHRPDMVSILLEGPKIEHNSSDNIYIKICELLDLRYFIIITKFDCIDACKIPYSLTNKLVNSEIIEISCVTKHNIDKIDTLIKGVATYNISHDNISNKRKKDVEFMIYDKIFIPDIGMIVMGVLKSGMIKIGDQLLLGPDLETVEIMSIHQKQIPVSEIYTEESGSMLIKLAPKVKVTKNMMIINDILKKNYYTRFRILPKSDFVITSMYYWFQSGNMSCQVSISYNDTTNMFIATCSNDKKLYIKDGSNYILFGDEIYSGRCFRI